MVPFHVPMHSMLCMHSMHSMHTYYYAGTTFEPAGGGIAGSLPLIGGIIPSKFFAPYREEQHFTTLEYGYTGWGCSGWVAGRRESDVGIGRVCFNTYEGVQTLVVGFFPVGKEAHAPNTDRRRRRLVSQPSEYALGISPPPPPPWIPRNGKSPTGARPGQRSYVESCRKAIRYVAWKKESAPGKKCWWLPASTPPPVPLQPPKKRKLHVTIRRSYVILCHILYPNIP